MVKIHQLSTSITQRVASSQDSKHPLGVLSSMARTSHFTVGLCITSELCPSTGGIDWGKWEPPDWMQLRRKYFKINYFFLLLRNQKDMCPGICTNLKWASLTLATKTMTIRGCSTSVNFWKLLRKRTFLSSLGQDPISAVNGTLVVCPGNSLTKSNYAQLIFML